MPKPGFTDRNKLKDWANTRQAQADLPRLVRRLILETAPGVVELGMPAGEGVAAGKWDGSVRSVGSNAWVPDGPSVWELSVDSSPGVKANKDWEKRSKADGSKELTYIQLILRPWNDRINWAIARRKEDIFKDVFAYGLDDVDRWMESAPITWAWFSEELGLQPYGLRTGSTWWDAWARQISPVATPDLVLAGRQQAVEAVQNRLSGPGITTVEGTSVDEVCAVISAIAVAADSEGDDRTLARLAFVNDQSTWRRLLESPQPLVLVPSHPEFASEVPSTSQHCVLVPISGTGVADISLPPLDAVAVATALKAAGMDNDKEASEAGRLARRSLMALRRNLATNIALHTPPWASAPIPRDVRAALLAGAWLDRVDGDKSVIEELSGTEYESFQEKATALSLASDPLLLKVGESWQLLSPFDSRLLLVKGLNRDDLGRLEESVTKVLGEEDPALDIPEQERWWRAAHEGKVRQFSEELRRGIARSVALLGVHGSSTNLPGGSSGSDWANYLVRSRLKAANDDPTGRLWASISDVLTMLAEGGPAAFIDAVTVGTSGANPTLATIFTDSQPRGALLTTPPHVGLLCALEAVAWSPDHFGAAVELLARLDEIDPGGSSAKRPFNSLTSIFRPWHPETSVSAARRVGVIDGLRKRHNEVACKLLLSMLPKGGREIHSPTYEPTFRDWKGPEPSVTTAEYLAFISNVVQLCIQETAVNGARWQDLLSEYPHLPPNDRDSVLKALTAIVDAGILSPENRTLIWDSLRSTIADHREYSHARWALPESTLASLDELVLKLEPGDAYSQYEWLFRDDTPHLEGSTLRHDYAAYQALLAERRRDAIAAIENEGGLDLVQRLAASVEVSPPVGLALAEVAPTYDDVLLSSLGESPATELQLACQYYSRRYVQEGWAWLGSLLNGHPDLSALQRARLLLATREYPAAWERADEQGEDVAGQFWLNFSPYGLGADFDHVAVSRNG